MALIAYLLVFCTYFSSTIMYFFPSLFSYRQFALFVAIVAAIALIRYLIKERFRISVRALIWIFFALSVVTLYWITPVYYRDTSSHNKGVYSSFWLALCGQTVPVMVFGALIAGEPKIQNAMKQWAPIIGMMFTVVAFVAAFNPSSITSGGFAENENGLNYQSIAYLAAYSSALLEYYLLSRDEVEQFGILEFKCMAYVAVAMVFVNALSILIAGGRGGFVAYVFFLFVTVYFAFRKVKLSVRTLVQGLGIGIVLVVAGVFAVRYAFNSTISTNGFSRIMGLISGVGDVGRSSLRERAISFFSSSPIVGHGLGSILLEYGIYSHNMFTDALAETGLVGTAVYIYLIVATIHRGFGLIREDFSNCLWAYIFLCGILMALFSGYYLTQFPMWFVISMMFGRVRKNNKGVAKNNG